MWLYALLYHFKTTGHNLREHKVTVLLSLAAVAFTLLLFGSYLLLLTNLQSMAARLGGRLQIVVYLAKDLPEEERLRLKQVVMSRKETESVAYCSPAKALEYLAGAMGEAAAVLEGLPENPLPPSFEVGLKKGYRNLEAVRRVARDLSRLPGVEDVDYGGTWVRRFFAFLRILRWLALSLGGLLLFASVIVISSTLTLGFYARREEIEILRLVGATEAHVRFPYFLESLVQGMGGAVLAVGLLWILYQAFRIGLGESWGLIAGWAPLHFLPLRLTTLLIFLGAVIGVISSAVSFVRFPLR